MSDLERYGTCSDANGHWGIEDDGKVILSGLVSHDACDAVMDILDERDALKAEVERLTTENESLQAKATNIYNAMVVRCKIEEITHKANADSIISQGMMSEAMKMMEESVAIRAQVERLTKESDIFQKCCEHQKNRIERLKQNEQLIDAGNALHDAAKIAVKWGVTATQMGMPRALYDACRNWNAAKGVQS